MLPPPFKCNLRRYHAGDDGGASVEMELEIVDMNYAMGSHQIGNTMNGVARFSYWYPAGRQFTAMFTGGDRVDSCVAENTTVDGGCDSHVAHMLRNNAGGRFRVATNVIVPPAATVTLKRSPEIAAPAIIPVAMPSRVGEAARFQVMAFDYDGDALTFRMGTREEYGGVIRSKSSVLPFSLDPSTGRPTLRDGQGCSLVHSPILQLTRRLNSSTRFQRRLSRPNVRDRIV